jgi:hypothetical protein
MQKVITENYYSYYRYQGCCKVDNARGPQSETRGPQAGEYADRGRIIITAVVPSTFNARLVSCVDSVVS